MDKSIFQTLSEINITPMIKEKNKIKYLPWSSAWSLIKEHYPQATFEVIKDERTGNNYFTDNRTCWVEVEITIQDEVQRENLAVMDYKNQPILAEKVTSVDVNKAQKRCLVKCAALFGLGLNLWYGEELSASAKIKKETDEISAKSEAAKVRMKHKEVLEEFQKAIDRGVDKGEIYDNIESISGEKNPNLIKDAEVCDLVIEAVKKMGVGKK